MTKTPTKTPITILQYFPRDSAGGSPAANGSPAHTVASAPESAVADTPLANPLSLEGEGSQSEIATNNYTTDSEGS